MVASDNNQCQARAYTDYTTELGQNIFVLILYNNILKKCKQLPLMKFYLKLCLRKKFPNTLW